MPINRSPPPSGETTPVFKAPLQYASDSNTSEPYEHDKDTTASSTGKIRKTSTVKRKRGDTDDLSKAEVMEMFKKIREEQDAKFSTLLNSNNEIKVAMEFMSVKYDDILLKLQATEEENKSLQKRVKALEEQSELFSRNSRNTSIEIRNLPQIQKETKNDLKNIIKHTAESLNVTVDTSEIKDVYRINTKSAIKPIIADFTTVGTKENLINAYKKFNKSNVEKFNTSCLKVKGQKQQIYISENLTQRERKLYYLARDTAKTYHYSFCWISFGKIFLRKSEGTTPIRINNEMDIEKLKSI